MALGGITTVGEFHYLHRAPDGSLYDDPNLLAREVTRAAREVGIRIALLNVAYARSGFETPPDARQRRFIETDPQAFLRRTEQLAQDIAATDNTTAGSGRRVTGNDNAPLPRAWVGVAPHSVRAVPLDYLKAVFAFADESGMVAHMHVAEQPAEIDACRGEYGRTPIELLDTEGLLGQDFTAVHAVYITTGEARSLAAAGAIVCACPTTERNLGDGIVPADVLFQAGARIALGTDSHAQIDLLEDARELEYHLRLRKLERAVLAPAKPRLRLVEFSREASARTREPNWNPTSALAARLFDCATSSGAESLNATAGEIAEGRAADFFTVDLNDPTVAGANEEDLLSTIVFSLSRAGVREVVVDGNLIIQDGRHASQEEIVQRFTALQRKLWE
jgi:formimidoylglutamate deiminase